jgi:hypothetical protein
VVQRQRQENAILLGYQIRTQQAFYLEHQVGVAQGHALCRARRTRRVEQRCTIPRLDKGKIHILVCQQIAPAPPIILPDIEQDRPQPTIYVLHTPHLVRRGKDVPDATIC